MEVTAIDPPVYYTHLESLAPQGFFWDSGNLPYAGSEDLAIDHATGQTRWDAAKIPAGVMVPGEHTLPASLHRGAEPAWLGELPWPPTGPDVDGMVQQIPAERCYETNGLGTGGTFDQSACS